MKTRLQTAKHVEGQPPVTLRGVATQLLREEGPRGLLRGAGAKAFDVVGIVSSPPR